MSVFAKAPRVVHFPTVVDERFLRSTVDALERLREESDLRGHSMLASLLAIAKCEAEDDLKTRAKIRRLNARGQDRDDGAAMMAQKLARRGAKQSA
ncbi:MAG: hypothetical protein ACRED5_03095 [Propylenella sp.]